MQKSGKEKKKYHEETCMHTIKNQFQHRWAAPAFLRRIGIYWQRNGKLEKKLLQMEVPSMAQSKISTDKKT